MITKLTAVGPDRAGSCPKWLAFLEEATGSDTNFIAFLQRLCGYALTGDTREQVLAFVYGPGGNGKSVFVNTIAGIMKDYAKVAPTETFTTSRFDRHPTELAMLRGARLVAASETEEGRVWAASRIKQLTGSDPITARYLRQDFFTFTPQFKLAIIGNHAPQLGRVDDAIRRRFLVIPFTQKPKAPDQELEEKLRTEWPAILCWMIEGCLKWQGNGLQPPPAVLAATQDYLDQEDVVGQWFDECCDIEQDAFVSVVAAFCTWKEFAKARGHEPGNERGFSSELKRRGFQKKNRTIHGKPTKAWIGFTIGGRQ